MLAMTVPQLDFVLECYALDHPTEYTFSRPSAPPPAAQPQTTAAWFNVLRGSALERFMGGRINHAAIAASKARTAIFGIRGKGKV
jgi:hypothetical protein